MGDDELGFEVEMGNEATEMEREKDKRREVQKWQIAPCWEVPFSLGPRAWSTPGTRETEESAARRFTSPSPGEQCIVLFMCVPWSSRRSMEQDGRMYD